jgi:glutamate formiminotransferase
MNAIEAVPNISEGRRADVLEAAADAVRQVRGLSLLDLSSDPSHNRTVLTLVGNGPELIQGLLALYDVAVEAIDLRKHRGEHPRIGAVDVVPFVPWDQTSMAECVKLAGTLGEAVAARYDIPVYLYGDAARHDDRRALENVRRGQFEGLQQRMRLAGGSPDFGPASPHPTAGASAIGARQPLIAFNVNLDTDDLDIARQIARAVRERDGGLPHVKALGMRLEHLGLVQVSMNLTDHTRTPLHRVFARVEREAARHGVAVVESEVVGLVPAAALATAAAHTLRLSRLTANQVFEMRLAQETRRDSNRSDGGT